MSASYLLRPDVFHPTVDEERSVRTALDNDAPPIDELRLAVDEPADREAVARDDSDTDPVRFAAARDRLRDR